jgi:hypothetical protein
LHLADRKKKANLLAYSGDPRTEAAKGWRSTEIIGHLLQVVADDAELELVGEEVGGSPVDMEIDTVLILRVSVLEIVGRPATAENSLPVVGLK